MSTPHKARPVTEASIPVQRVDRTTAPGTPAGDPVPESTRGPAVAARALAVLRMATGFVFLWAFVDKLFGWGYATQSKNAWVNGGSPTKGFLSGVHAGPFQSMFHSWAGAGWADWLFMLGLLSIGLAATLGVALRIAAVAGTLMMLFMWVAEWPFAQHTATGAASGSTNPLVDYHIVYALALIVAAAAYAGNTWGLGRMWSRLSVVSANRWLL
ncbi:DoxX family membrane protein [Solihabitans fulvus]|uniref:DoxX family membrane protein n=1 Tax=Solihabitans fulvus TaxID=1892852 RepID=A0A5B2XGF6_9PSEU|nr:DoxX family membrane protein [Solihabitans fulvus]KAA2261852.1 DoxX family membrane protein [Solihabitans fulvus]